MSSQSHHQLLLISGTNTEWNPVLTVQFAYSNGFKTATMSSFFTANSYMIIGNATRSSGKRVFRIHMDGSGAWTSPFCTVGISSVFTLLNAVGQDTNSLGYYQQTGQSYFNNVLSAFGAAYDTGDTIGVYADIPGGKLYFDKNGTYQGGGDPAAGTGGLSFSFGPFVYPAVSMYQSAANLGHGMTLMTSVTEVGSVPSGWTAWDG